MRSIPQVLYLPGFGCRCHRQQPTTLQRLGLDVVSEIDASRHSSREMPQVVIANLLSSNRFQSRFQIKICERLVIQMTLTANRNEQQSISFGFGAGVQVSFDIGSDMRRDHNGSVRTRFLGADTTIAAAMRHVPSDALQTQGCGGRVEAVESKFRFLSGVAPAEGKTSSDARR